MAARGMQKILLQASSLQAHRASLGAQPSGASSDASVPARQRPQHVRSLPGLARSDPALFSTTRHSSTPQHVTAPLDARLLLDQPSVIRP